MRMHINPDRCEGHARCVARAPELVDVHDDGTSYVLVDEVPENQQEAAQRAVDACPERAISLVAD